MRIRQWLKNIFILAALVFDLKLFEPVPLTRTIAGLIIFCFLSSCVYIINDIMDRESDRQHPTKRNRPIASGKLPVNIALIVAASFIIITIPISFILSTGFGIISVSYFIINLAYSLKLKHIPLIDVLILALGYVLRVAAGVSLIHVERFSPWLYIAMFMLALFLGLGKRRGELINLENNQNVLQRRVLEGYNLSLLDQLITIVISTAIIVYCFYTFSAPNVPSNHAMMLTIPFVVYGIFRYLYLIQVKKEGSAPEDIAFHDRPLQATLILWGLSVIAVFYLFK